jgi:hypothetical protein
MEKVTFTFPLWRLAVLGFDTRKELSLFKAAFGDK